MTRRRRLAALCAASALLAVASAWAAPRTPCTLDGIPASILQLQKRVEATRDPSVWLTIANDADARTATGSSAARACAQYTAAQARFYLAARGRQRQRHAMAAVRHLVIAEALTPDAMTDRQPQARLARSWQQVGAVEGWLSKRSKPVAVELPARPGTVVLRPGDPARWRAACGPTCVQSIELPLDADHTRVVHLRPGRWQVELVTACGRSPHTVTVDGGVLRLPSDPPCPVTLEPHDANKSIKGFRMVNARGEAIESAVAIHNPITVRAAGYLPETVQVSPAGGRLPVPMRRCPVEVVVRTSPGDATVEGAGPRPWGMIEVRAERPGYAVAREPVKIERPANCQNARHSVELPMRRKVAVAAVDGDGDPVVPAGLWVDGNRVEQVGLALTPGPHQFQAEHPALGTITDTFVVDACAQGNCPASILRISFERPLRPSKAVPYTFVGAGVVTGLVGVGFGAAATAKQGDISSYTTRREEGTPIADLVDARDQYARTADTALLVGGTLIVTGLIWLATGDD